MRSGARRDQHRDEGGGDADDPQPILPPAGQNGAHRQAGGDAQRAVQRGSCSDDRRHRIDAPGRVRRGAVERLRRQHAGKPRAELGIVGRHAREQLAVVAFERQHQPRNLHRLAQDGGDDGQWNLGDHQHALALRDLERTREIERAFGGREIQDRRADGERGRVLRERVANEGRRQRHAQPLGRLARRREHARLRIDHRQIAEFEVALDDAAQRTFGAGRVDDPGGHEIAHVGQQQIDFDEGAVQRRLGTADEALHANLGLLDRFGLRARDEPTGGGRRGDNQRPDGAPDR